MRHEIGLLAELPPGGHMVAAIDRRQILVVRGADGRVWAIADRCPHQGARLSEGPQSGAFIVDNDRKVRLQRNGEVVRCPWHNFAFDVTTGCALLEPDRYRVRTYDVVIDDDRIYVEA